jgi:hypothetical protein
MSGGSFNYQCYNLQDTYSGNMEDIELNELIDDMVIVLHDLEWWRSGDYSEDDYREAVQKFKSKWFGKRDENLRETVSKELLKLKETIEKL